MVGDVLGTKLVLLGHKVMMGSRTENNEKALAWKNKNGALASNGTFADAAAFGEIIFNCTSGKVSLEALQLAGRENLGFLTGKGASQEEVNAFIQAAEAIPGVLRVHHIMAEYVGPRLMIDMHVNVDGSKTLTEAHQITDSIIARLEEFPHVDRAYVHVEPHDWKD